jgi:hypothetical protein
MTETRAPWWVLPALACMAQVIFAGALAASCFLGDNTLRTQMFTGALTLATAAAQYFFGSSAGSQKKDDTIAANSVALASSAPIPAPGSTTVTTTTVP